MQLMYGKTESTSPASAVISTMEQSEERLILFKNHFDINSGLICAQRISFLHMTEIA